ncbi:glycerophosphodiester phosphodiesterase family protein [Saccharospirillum salsuginis]|uniref:GP-PDE domain-containing protein n=1 Tax=Saccharospirillum salsuginis TaxID=418750 RepID=A0A918NE43_9GAMM|nr:glycerophosphodiester phosphodiesterase family protein [Saccharospirillum salsuginis]GGX65841.1 hypothetical protein GCM10007392_36820 [Saccharospirillum salsuginis]
MKHPSLPGGVSARWLILATLFLAIIVACFRQAPAPESPDDTVDIIAHGGAQGHAPANTLAAFDLALNQGATVLEMDVQQTADDHLVVIHDDTLDRTTDGTGAIAETTLAELKALDAGWAFEDDSGGFPYRGRGVAIPTLAEVFERYPDTPMIIELKTEGGTDIIQPVIDLVKAFEREDDVVLASFSEAFLQPVREQLPTVRTNMPESESTDFFIRQLLGIHPWWQPPGDLLQVPATHTLKLGPITLEDMTVPTPGFVRAAHRLGLDVQVWTINDPDLMHALLDAGVDGLITDYPDRARAVIAEREASRLAVRGPDVLAHYDDQLARAEHLQEDQGWLTPLMQAVTFLGDEEFYLIAFPILYWTFSRHLGIRIGLMLLLTAGLNSVLKLVLATPRPLFLKPELGLVHESSFGVPSGHSQNAAAIWGTTAVLLRRWWLALPLVGLIGLIGWSRIHLGAHFLEDILSGWAIGALLVLGFVLLSPRIEAWWSRQSPAQRILTTVTVSWALIAAAALLVGRLQGWSPLWPGLPDPEIVVALSHTVSPAGTLAGLGVGLVLLQSVGGFTTAGSWTHRLARLGIGFAGVLAFWLGLGAVFPGGEAPLDLTLRYLRYALVGAWVVGIAPILFVRLGLSQPDNPRTTAALG